VPTPEIPQGRISRRQIVSELGHNGVFTSALDVPHGGSAASVAYKTLYHGSATGEYEFLSIKFPNESAGKAFASAYLTTMTHMGGAQPWAGEYSDEHGFGVLPQDQREIYYILPHSAFGNLFGTTSIEQSLYPNGTYFLLVAVDFGSTLPAGDPKIGGYAQLIDVTFKLCSQHPSSCPNSAGS
jgi:hypothetical protein